MERFSQKNVLPASAYPFTSPKFPHTYRIKSYIDQVGSGIVSEYYEVIKKRERKKSGINELEMLFQLPEASCVTVV